MEQSIPRIRPGFKKKNRPIKCRMQEVLEYLNPLSSLSRSDIYRIKKQKKEEKKPYPPLLLTGEKPRTASNVDDIWYTLLLYMF